MVKKLIFGIFLSGLLSCQITERVYLSESGMIRQQTEVDFSSMLGLALSPEKIDSMKMAGEFPLDTVVSLAETGMLPGSEDEVSEAEIQFRKSMDKTKVRMLIDEEEAKFVLFNEEMSIADFNNYQKTINESYRLLKQQDKKSADEFVQSGYGSMLQFSYDNDSFERKVLNDKVDFDSQELDSMGLSVREMMKMYTYKLEYHFPKKVKSTTLKKAEISPDGKTLAVDVDMADLLENPDNYNFKVEF